MVAGGYFTYYGAVLEFHGIAVTGDCAVKDFDADEFLFGAEFFLGDEGFASYEFGFVQFAEDSKAGFYGADFGTQFIAIQGEAGFKAQGITAAQAAGLTPKGLL